MKKTLYSSAIALALIISTNSGNASTVFSDNYQSNDLSANWQKVGSADIVSAPGGGNALGFTQGGSGGDLFSNYYTSSTGRYTLSFEYDGIGAGGGYIGINNPGEWWIFGDGSYATTYKLTDDNGWNSYSVTFNSSSPVQIKLEEWNGRNSIPNEALFKDLVLTDGNGLSGNVPEPTSIALLMTGLFAFSLSRKKVVQA